jgi:hypothetical protein
MMRSATPSVLFGVTLAAVVGVAATAGAQTEPINFTDHIRPIMERSCWNCHGEAAQLSDLDLSSREGALEGGTKGPAIVPGRAEDSRLFRMVAGLDQPFMPMSGDPLSDAELVAVRTWIDEGAHWDAGEVTVAADALAALENDALPPGARDYWAFQHPEQAPVPASKTFDHPIDRFLEASRQDAGATAAPRADRLTLLRRAYLDLIGLPPTLEQVEEFLADTERGAWERLIDKLLDSPHYGERWGRHWLDVARYADTDGFEQDYVRPNAWRYRDYIIDAFNDDKPYNQFLREQMAGDELDHVTDETRIATGFLRSGPRVNFREKDNPERRHDYLDDMLATVGRGVLGMTVHCARCHDHKYDPIPQRDYYRLSAVLRSAYDPYDWLSPNESDIGPDADWNETNSRLLPGAPANDVEEAARINAPVEDEVARLAGELEELPAPLRKKLLEEKVPTVPNEALVDARNALSKSLTEDLAASAEEEAGSAEDSGASGSEAISLLDSFVKAKLRLHTKPLVRALFDMGGDPTPVHVLYRGDHRNPGPPVAPGVPSVLGIGLEPYTVEPLGWSSGRRLALARWLVQPNHPLTARVMVNRVWQHHFGRGIVRSEANFGRTGTPPTHPELLDWLAVEFVKSGWSLKALHRLIVTSTAYRQSSTLDAAKLEADFENALLSRFPLRRLDADAIRDTVLKVSQRLDATPFGPADEIEVQPDGEVIAKDSPKGQRRSIYVQQRRSKPVTMLEAFDAPQLKPNCLRRTKSTVASQALEMMNSEILRTSSRYMAGRIMDEAGEDPAAQVNRAYMTALGRLPSAGERADAVSTLTEMTNAWRRRLDERVPMEPKVMKARWLALATLCHTVLNSAEFLYID